MVMLLKKESGNGSNGRYLCPSGIACIVVNKSELKGNKTRFSRTDKVYGYRTEHGAKTHKTR